MAKQTKSKFAKASDEDLLVELQKRGYRFGEAPGRKFEMEMVGKGKEAVIQRVARIMLYCPLGSPFNKGEAA